NRVIEALNDETNDSIEVSDEDIYNLAEKSVNKYPIVVSYRDADISSDDDSSCDNCIPDDDCNWKIAYLDEERLKIRKEFEEADKLIPKLAATAYPDSHPEAVWTSCHLYFPDLVDKLSKLTF
ncbi:18551_t:CDS:2, partial [Gigaspora margarita]